MYKIQKKPWGFHLTFADIIDRKEMQQWLEESSQAVKATTTGFGVFVDMRTLKPLAADVQAVMQEGQKLFKAAGMTRSVVILASKLVTLQFQRIAKETGIYEWERYIDASSIESWEAAGIAWVRDRIDPDVQVA